MASQLPALLAQLDSWQSGFQSFPVVTRFQYPSTSLGNSFSGILCNVVVQRTAKKEYAQLMIFGRPVSFLQASHLSLVCWTLVGQDKCWSYEIKWDVCCIHILEIISDFCGWPFVRSFALCYDHCHCGQGARGWSAQIWPQLKSGHCGSPCIKPSWTPLAPFVQEPGHWATIYNINFTFGRWRLDVVLRSSAILCQHFHISSVDWSVSFHR